MSFFVVGKSSSCYQKLFQFIEVILNNSFSILTTKYGKLLFKDGIEYDKAICEIC